MNYFKVDRQEESSPNTSSRGRGSGGIKIQSFKLNFLSNPPWIREQPYLKPSFSKTIYYKHRDQKASAECGSRSRWRTSCPNAEVVFDESRKSSIDKGRERKEEANWLDAKKRGRDNPLHYMTINNLKWKITGWNARNKMSDQEYLADMVRGPRDYRIEFE